MTSCSRPIAARTRSASSSPERDEVLAKVAVGVGPNGLAYDPRRGLLLAANVGDPSRPGSFTVSMVDVAQRKTRIADVPVAGRTRWAIFDPETDCFYVNIADPPQIAVIEASAPATVARTFAVPAAGPHGLDLDPAGRRLFCACDGKRLIASDSRSGDGDRATSTSRGCRTWCSSIRGASASTWRSAIPA